MLTKEEYDAKVSKLRQELVKKREYLRHQEEEALDEFWSKFHALRDEYEWGEKA